MGVEGELIKLPGGHFRRVTPKPPQEERNEHHSYPDTGDTSGLDPEKIKAYWRGYDYDQYGMMMVGTANRFTVYALCDEVTRLRELVEDQKTQINDLANELRAGF